VARIYVSKFAFSKDHDLLVIWKVEEGADEGF
jgi:hypothetical protein